MIENVINCCWNGAEFLIGKFQYLFCWLRDQFVHRKRPMSSAWTSSAFHLDSSVTEWTTVATTATKEIVKVSPSKVVHWDSPGLGNRQLSWSSKVIYERLQRSLEGQGHSNNNYHDLPMLFKECLLLSFDDRFLRSFKQQLSWFFKVIHRVLAMVILRLVSKVIPTSTVLIFQCYYLLYKYWVRYCHLMTRF